MPKFPENKGFKMPGLGSKEKHTPGNFREEHQVDKIGYCDDTPINMLPPGSSPATFMGNEPLASSSDGSPLTYQWSLDDDPYTSVKYTPGSLDFSDAIRPKTEKNPDGKQNGGEGGVDSTLVKEQITNTTPDKESYSGESAKSKLGREMTAEEKAWEAAEVKKLGRQGYRDKYNIGTKTTTPGSTSTVYKVDGKVVDKATYDASGSVNKSKEKK